MSDVQLFDIKLNIILRILKLFLMKNLLITLSLILFAQISFSQFVDTLIVSESKNYSVFGMANYNCKETHADLGCKSDKQTNNVFYLFQS